MKKKLSKLIALTAMFAMVLVLTPEPASAASIEVGIFGNGGTMTITSRGTTYTTPDTSETVSSGTSLKALGYTKVSVKHPKGYQLLGWHPYIDKNPEWEKIDGAKLLTTSEMLNYELPGRSVVFYAQWNMSPDYQEGIRVYVAGAGNKLTATINGKTKTDYSFEGGSEPGSSLKKAGYTKFATPKHSEGFAFEGWTVYKAVSNGWKVIKGAECLTTTEMLNYAFPKQDVKFLVKWRGLANADELEGEEVPEGLFSIQAEDGSFRVTEADGSTFKTSGCGRGGPAGTTISDTGYIAISKPIHKKGKDFLGWRVYKLDKKGQPVRLKGYGTLTTKEVLNFKLKNYEILFMARWGCDHAYKNLSVKKATSADSGYRKVQCKKCGFKTKLTTPKINSVTLSYSKVTYNGNAKTPKIIVRDVKGNRISSKHYTVKYAKGRKAVGRYKVVVTFKGNYKGAKSRYFTIVPKAPEEAAAVSNAAGTATFSWSKAKGATGYSVYYKAAGTSKYTLLKRTTATSVEKTDLVEGTEYIFKVVPYYKSGKTRYSSIKCKTAKIAMPVQTITQ